MEGTQIPDRRSPLERRLDLVASLIKERDHYQGLAKKERQLKKKHRYLAKAEAFGRAAAMADLS